MSFFQKNVVPLHPESSSRVNKVRRERVSTPGHNL
jgi:hypothetical protein